MASEKTGSGRAIFSIVNFFGEEKKIGEKNKKDPSDGAVGKKNFWKVGVAKIKKSLISIARLVDTVRIYWYFFRH